MSIRRGLLALAAGTACALVGALPAQAAEELGAEIRRTSHGIPHIKAKDIAGIGYGYGYAFAQDNLCEAAEMYVTVSAQRSRYFGPDGRIVFRGNGSTASNVNSDFFYQRIIDSGVVERQASAPPPMGPKPEILEGVRGYVAGYNEYLRDIGGRDGVSDPRCHGEEWVREITEDDVLRRFYQLLLLASQGVAVDGIAEASPPTPPSEGEEPASAQPRTPRPEELRHLQENLPLGAIGSNAYGLGREATASGHGMVLGNPHFPWDGPERFYQAQITIPGKGSVAGASLYGVPLILIGHTQKLAWSHTVSTAFRFTPFELRLVPGSPTTYLVDGQPREMKREKVTIQVRGEDGELESRTRTLYSTHHGPVFTELLGQPLFPWTPVTAYAMGDANAGGFGRLMNHFYDVNFADSVAELDAIERRYQGIPWVNTIAADSEGNAYYADIGNVPNVSDEKATACAGALGLVTFTALNLPTLDGSRSACEWDSDPDAPAPGLIGDGNMPSLTRSDYVTNSNDSFWLTNPEQPLEGFPRIIGSERTERSLRTRLGLRLIQDRLASGDRYDLSDLQADTFNNRVYSAELWRDELVAACREGGAFSGLEEACEVLAAWDMRDDLDSRGSPLWRRFVTHVLSETNPLPLRPENAATDHVLDTLLFDVPFDVEDPVNTPRGLNTSNPMVAQALRDAVEDLRSNGIPIDVPLGEFQTERRGGEDIPIHGGPHNAGVFNVITAPFRGEDRSPSIAHGSSFVMAAHLNGRCPDSRSILTYSQSTNPRSPWYGDQTRLYSQKRWVDMRFCEEEIRQDPNLQIRRLGDAFHDCEGDDTETTRPRLRRGERIRSVEATVDGEHRNERILRGGRAARISLRGMEPGKATLRLEIRTTGDRVIRDRRTVRTCVTSPS